jgi:hypothetical protein
MIQQNIFLVCRRTNNYFVVLSIDKRVVFFATVVSFEFVSSITLITETFI